MGSLMAGWGSHSLDPKTVIFERNKSSTKEEIEAYWRSKKGTEDEEHLKVISTSPKSIQETEHKEPGKFQRSSSTPLTDRKGNFIDVDADADAAIEKLKQDWWTRTNWAFLNEPPVINTEGPSHKYIAQYHVTAHNSSKPDAQAEKSP